MHIMTDRGWKQLGGGIVPYKHLLDGSSVNRPLQPVYVKSLLEQFGIRPEPVPYIDPMHKLTVIQRNAAWREQHGWVKPR